MVQYTETYQCNPLNKQTQRNKTTHRHFIIGWKIFWQNSAFFLVKSLGKNRIKGPDLNIVKAVYNKPVANIKQNGEKIEAIPLK